MFSTIFLINWVSYSHCYSLFFLWHFHASLNSLRCQLTTQLILSSKYLKEMYNQSNVPHDSTFHFIHWEILHVAISSRYYFYQLSPSFFVLRNIRSIHLCYVYFLLNGIPPTLVRIILKFLVNELNLPFNCHFMSFFTKNYQLIQQTSQLLTFN